jgi:hypothetical protein
MKKRILSFLLILSLAASMAFFSACTQQAAPIPDGIGIKEIAGRAVTVPHDPQSICDQDAFAPRWS